jgi:hypothetical protein
MYYIWLMTWIYVLCVTFMVFIYVYYELFACRNLVYVMSFFTVFSFQWSISWKIRPVSTKIVQESSGRFSGKVGDFSMNLTNNSVKPAEICVSKNWLFLRPCQPNFTEFFWFFQNPMGSPWSEFYLPAKFSNPDAGTHTKGKQQEGKVQFTAGLCFFSIWFFFNQAL